MGYREHTLFWLGMEFPTFKKKKQSETNIEGSKVTAEDHNKLVEQAESESRTFLGVLFYYYF